MKRLLINVGNAVLITAVVYAVFGAITSAFEFYTLAWAVLPVWCACAAVLSIIVTRWRTRGLLACLPVILAMLIWKRAEFLTGARYVIFFITDAYDKWFGFTILFPRAKAAAGDLVTFWRLAGICLMLPLSAAVCVRKSAILTVLIAVPLMLPTFVMKDYPPNPVYLAILLVACLAMLFSSAFYPDDYGGRGLAVFPAIALALLLMGAAFLIAPPDKYDRGALVDNIDARIREVIEKQPETVFSGVGWPVLGSNRWRFNTERVEIADAGVRQSSNESALRIRSTQSGTFYLRGYSMQYFDGREWQINSDTLISRELEAAALNMPASIAWAYGLALPEDTPDLGVMTIEKLGDRTAVDYRPYYSLDNALGESDEVAFLSVDNILSAGHMAFSSGLGTDLSDYNAWAQQTYTQIDESTTHALRQIAAQEGIDPDASKAEIVDWVAKYVSSSARYTLSPFVIPRGEDFALYFLQESRQGYCIHFATAATLMLRSLDIPARFTSGFLVTVREGEIGQDVIVPFSAAHAWVEVYYDNVGWVPLEVTPSSARSGVPPSVPHSGGNTETPESPPTAEPEQTPERNLRDRLPTASPDSTPTATAEPSVPAMAQARDTTGAARWIIIATIALVCVAAAIVLRVNIAARIRERDFAQKDTNAAALCAWRYIARIDRNAQPPEELEELTQKARFSRHQLSEAERAAVIEYAVTLRAETLENAGIFRRLWIRLVLGL